MNNEQRTMNNDCMTARLQDLLIEELQNRKTAEPQNFF
jgi:hypothetical protein